MSCLVVGSIGLDNIDTPLKSYKMIVGGSATFFSNAAHHFAPIKVVGVVGDDFTEEHMSSFESENIDTSDIAKCQGRTFHWHGKYNEDLSEATTLDTVLGVFETFQPKISDSSGVENLFLANIDPDLQFNVLNEVKVPGVVALDTMNLWIDIKLDSLKKVMSKVDILFINEGEAIQLSKETNILKMAEVLQKLGPSTVIVKRGAHGVFMLKDSDIFVLPAFPKCHPLDTTGAGDSFAGGFMGYITQQKTYDFNSYKKALAYGTMTASYAIESFSVESLRNLSLEKINERYHDFIKMVQL